VSRVGLSAGTKRVQLKGGTRVMAGCCCAEVPCVNDEFLYGVLKPCIPIVANYCDQSVVQLRCMTVRMDRLPVGLAAGQTVRVFGLCYEVAGINLTRCQAITDGCPGGESTEVALEPEDIASVPAGVNCLSPACQCTQVGQYALRCDRTVNKNGVYCPSAGCSLRSCRLWGPGPLVCVPDGQAPIPIPPEDGQTCCQCDGCETWGYLQDSRNSLGPRTDCCCGSRNFNGTGNDPLPCSYAYSNTYRYEVVWNQALYPDEPTRVVQETVTCGGGAVDPNTGSRLLNCVSRYWETLDGNVVTDLNNTFTQAVGCELLRSLSTGGGWLYDYLLSIGENTNRGVQGCASYSDAATYVDSNSPAVTVTTSATETSTMTCGPQPKCRGTCNNGGRGVAAINGLDFGVV
jgi:hypothetical protein